MGTFLFVVLVLVLIGTLPTWSPSRLWGYFPGGLVDLGVLVVVLLAITGRFGSARSGGTKVQ